MGSHFFVFGIFCVWYDVGRFWTVFYPSCLHSAYTEKIGRIKPSITYCKIMTAPVAQQDRATDS